MKKSFVVVVCALFVWGAGFGLAHALDSEINSGGSGPVEEAVLDTALAVAPECTIVDAPYGSVVALVHDSNKDTENMYWMQHISNGVTYKRVEFILQFRTDSPATSPLKTISHVFKLSPASHTGIGAPFGVPYWGSSIAGPARLVVKSTRPSGVVKVCKYDFTVEVQP